MLNEKILKRGVAVVLAGVLALGTFAGIGAYFTSTSSSSDTYTIGKVEVELNKDNFSKELLLPLSEYELQREATNTGMNDAYIFMTVSIPYTSTETINDDPGMVHEQKPYTQVLTFGHDKTEGANSQFKLVENGHLGELSISTVADHDIQGQTAARAVVDEEHKCVTYVYAYVDEDGNLQKLSPDAKTGYLFDYMKVANLADKWNMATDGEVLIKVYAIQTNNILTDVEFAGSEEDGTTDIEKVWEVVQKAAFVTGSTHEPGEQPGTDPDDELPLGPSATGSDMESGDGEGGNIDIEDPDDPFDPFADVFGPGFTTDDDEVGNIR